MKGALSRMPKKLERLSPGVYRGAKGQLVNQGGRAIQNQPARSAPAQMNPNSQFGQAVAQGIGMQLPPTRDENLRQFATDKQWEILEAIWQHGSIPRAMEIGSFALASGVNQVFRNMKGARSLVLKVEGLPKYWKRGFLKHEDGCEDTRVWRSYSEILKGKPLHTCHCIPTVAQELSSHEEFAAAAQVTIQIYTDNSPKSNDTRSPLAAYTGRKYNTGWSQFGQD